MAMSAGATAAFRLAARRSDQSNLRQPQHQRIVTLSLAIIVLFTLKGAATYGHSRSSCRRSATPSSPSNQRRLFAKLMRENVGFYSERHSSEFLARLTAGAQSRTQVLSLLINAVAAISCRW